MFTKSSKLLQLLQKTNKNTFATAKLGSLYTWGHYTSGTGFALSNTDPQVNIPKKLSQFDGNVAKVVMGPYHTAVITGNGELYTMGSGKYGALGLNSTFNSQLEPQLVEFFSQNELQVTDAFLGEHHTIVTTSKGEVYSFGFGGTSDFAPLDWIRPRVGALGSGQTTHRFEPGLVEGISQPVKISTGDNFAIAVGQKGEVYNWGCGKDGSFADGFNEAILTPQVNENFKLLQEKEGLTIKEIKSASHFSVALLSDGNLYSFGRNNQGAMGIRQNLGHKVDGEAYLPTKVIDENFKGQKIVDYSVGENSLVILTDKNQVFWSGLDLAFKPIQWEVPTDQKITKVVASTDCFAALTQNGQLYTFNDWVNREVATYVPGNEYFQSGKELFDNKNILDIGGNYGIRYALTN